MIRFFDLWGRNANRVLIAAIIVLCISFIPGLAMGPHNLGKERNTPYLLAPIAGMGLFLLFHLAFHAYVALLILQVKKAYTRIGEKELVMLCHEGIDSLQLKFAIRTLIPDIVFLYQRKPDLFSPEQAKLISLLRKTYRIS